MKEHDRVRAIGHKEVGIIERIFGDMAIVKYPDGKYKIHTNVLETVKNDDLYLSKDEYDQAVKDLISDIGREFDSNLEYVLEIVVMVCVKMRARLFPDDDRSV